MRVLAQYSDFYYLVNVIFLYNCDSIDKKVTFKEERILVMYFKTSLSTKDWLVDIIGLFFVETLQDQLLNGVKYKLHFQ
jgi:hypothetical protein